MKGQPFQWPLVMQLLDRDLQARSVPPSLHPIRPHAVAVVLSSLAMRGMNWASGSPNGTGGDATGVLQGQNRRRTSSGVWQLLVKNSVARGGGADRSNRLFLHTKPLSPITSVTLRVTGTESLRSPPSPVTPSSPWSLGDAVFARQRAWSPISSAQII